MLKVFTNLPLIIEENVTINTGNSQKAMSWGNLMEGMKN